jgi:hypothetical protein
VPGNERPRNTTTKMEAEMGSIEIRMPEGSGMTGFPVMGKAICWTVPVANPKRSFGEFAEKTIQCNAAARHAIDQVCRQGGFTQAWAGDEGPTFTMTKIPAIILVKLMLGLPEAQEKEVQSLIGAYAICMDPDSASHHPTRAHTNPFAPRDSPPCG